MGKVTTKRVILELKKLKKKMNKRYQIDKMLLFGSRAKGEELLDSDVDLIVVSKKFSSIPFKKRPDPFLDEWKFPVDLEVLCYSPEELDKKKKEYGLVREALKHGILV